MSHGRADGSLPPSPRRLHEDAYGLVRVHARIHPIVRRRLDERRQELVDGLDALDDELGDWMSRRRTLVTEARELHESLWPRVADAHVPRPPRPDAWPLPPMRSDATELWGPHLRNWCIAVLRRHGPCTLRELRALAHLYGFSVVGRNVPKVLSDALRLEVAQGRARRVERAMYDAVEPRPRRSTEPLLGEAPPDWYPAFVPPGDG